MRENRTLIGRLQADCSPIELAPRTFGTGVENQAPLIGLPGSYLTRRYSTENLCLLVKESFIDHSYAEPTTSGGFQSAKCGHTNRARIELLPNARINGAGGDP
jgi:hypothetical protein